MKHKILILVVLSNIYLISFSKAYAQQKLAYIDSQELLMALPEMKAAEQSFQTLQQQKQTELEKMDKELSLKMTQYESKYKTLSEANRETLEKELKALGAEIENLKKTLGESSAKFQQDLAAHQEKLYSPILEKAQVAIKSFAKEKGYAYVMDISQPGVLYFEGDDLTDIIKEKLSTKASSEKK